MHCRSCGSPLWPGSEICAGCGADVRVVPPPSYGAPPPYAAPAGYAPPPSSPVGPSRTALTSIVACLVLAAGALAVILATHTPAKNRPLSIPELTDPPGLTQLPAVTQAPVPTVAPSPRSPVHYVPSTLRHSWHLVETVGGGDQLGVTFALGSPQPATAGRKVGALALDTSCDKINPSTDAVIAAQVILKNSTPGPLPVGYALDVKGPISVDAIEVAGDSGVRCKVGLDASAVISPWYDTLPAGASRTSDMFFVLRGYYTASADARQSRLESTRVSFDYADGRSVAGTDELLTPGPLAGPDVGGDGAVSLAG